MFTFICLQCVIKSKFKSLTFVRFEPPNTAEVGCTANKFDIQGMVLFVEIKEGICISQEI